MEGGDLSSEPLQSSNWEVYKDALEPQPSRLVKAWERAPVAAHAPRLHGQKIWKRVNAKSGKGKENNNTADVELEKEGKGSRKKMRMAGDKENIANATWISSKDGHDTEEFSENPYSSPKKRDRRSLAAGEEDALLVPRKRTNANHLITPRKHARKVPLHGEAMVEFSIQSPARPQGQKVPLNDDTVGESGASVEKPPRRRKSMRKSIRRLTQTDMASLVPETILDVSAYMNVGAGFSKNNPEALEGFVADKAVKIAIPEISEPVEIPVANPLGESAVELSSEANLIAGITQNDPLKTAEEAPSAPDVSEVSDKDLVIFTSKPVPENITFEKNEESKTAKSEPSAEDQKDSRSDSAGEDIAPVTIVKNSVASEETTIFIVSLEPEIQQPILESIEEATETRIFSPSKSIRTPKKKGVDTPKKGRMTPQSMGTRRSTRVTRGSSVQPEGLPLQPDVQPDGATLAQPSLIEPLKEPLPISDSTIEPIISPPKDAISKASDDGATNVQLGFCHDDASTSASNDQASLDTPRGNTSTIQQELDQQLTEEISAMSSYPRESFSVNLNIISEDKTMETITDTAPLEALTFPESDSRSNSPSRDRSSRSASPEPFTGAESEPSPHSEVSEEQTFEVKHEANQIFEGSVETLEVLEPIEIMVPSQAAIDETVDELSDDFQETSTPNPTTTELVEAISKNASPTKEELSDTDMLRNFLSRVKANKAAKAVTAIPKRKRSLPHSPIQVPLGTESHLSPSSPKEKDEFDVSLPTPSPMKRRKPNHVPAEEDETEPKSIRRSGRTRLPIKAAPLAAPSFIPVRRLGQDGDSTITLRRNEEKELAALTRVNTRKNKGGAVHPQELLKKKSDEKEDPAARQRALKEIFDEKAKKQGKKGKSVVWAEELVHFQTMEGKKIKIEEPEKQKEKVPTTEEKKSAVKVGMRSKMSLGMAANGTPAPKRKMRGRS